jgi:hypothetical protein
MPFGTLLDSNRLLQPREIRMLRRISRIPPPGCLAMEPGLLAGDRPAEQAVFPLNSQPPKYL